MEINLKDLRKLLADEEAAPPSSDLVGCYVIVRCHDAGVHAGRLVSYSGREATLSESRRLWSWKPSENAKYLSGVAVYGLDAKSKIGEPVFIHLTETCEIIRCSDRAEQSISNMKASENV